MTPPVAQWELCRVAGVGYSATPPRLVLGVWAQHVVLKRRLDKSFLHRGAYTYIYIYIHTHTSRRPGRRSCRSRGSGGRGGPRSGRTPWANDVIIMLAVFNQ